MSELGKFLYRFAVITDAHIAESEDGNTSPFPVNRLASGRYRHAVSMLQQQDVDFILNLGDMVHPLPKSPAYAAAAARFHQLSAPLPRKQYFIPGNHDIGDKPSAWMPADPIDDNALDTYRTHFGADFQLIEHKGSVFFLLNAELINSGLNEESTQRQWLQESLVRYSGSRLFMAIHYPPFLNAPDEVDHYDNLAEPGRGWLLALLKKYQVEAVFSGHVHNFWLNRFGKTSMYVLPALSFVRQDYSEMYQTPPESEGGRNDHNKLGFITVDVHENNHVWHMHRTFGVEAAETQQSSLFKDRRQIGTQLHPLQDRPSGLALDMRQSWINYCQIPPSGALDEFYRKEVRNDYPVLALCELGIRELRIPLNDLANVATRERLHELQLCGFRYTGYSLGIPDKVLLDILKDNKNLLCAMEIIWPAANPQTCATEIAAFQKLTEIPVLVSPLWDEYGQHSADGFHYHVINHGFEAVIFDKIDDFFNAKQLPDAVSGLVFRLAVNQDFLRNVNAIAEMAEQRKITAHIHARLASDNPADWQTSQHGIAARVAIAQVSAILAPGVNIYLDTFADVDRGYFRRTGIVDRQYNPLAGWYVLRAINYQTLRMENNPAAIIDCVNAGVIPLFFNNGQEGENGWLVVGDNYDASSRVLDSVIDADSEFRVTDTANPASAAVSLPNRDALQRWLAGCENGGPFYIAVE